MIIHLIQDNDFPISFHDDLTMIIDYYVILKHHCNHHVLLTNSIVSYSNIFLTGIFSLLQEQFKEDCQK